MKCLFTAVGTRVELISMLKERGLKIAGVDCSELAPARHFTDSFYIVPEIGDENYVEELLNICKKEKIAFVVPLHEKEFHVLDSSRKRFEEAGTVLILSDRKVLDICGDKYNTYKFFKSCGIDTPESYTDENLEYANLNYPLFIKPRDGMGSKNAFKIQNEEELEFFIKYISSPIIQEFIGGTEYTIDVFCDMRGKAVSVVPRERIEVKCGEVSKSRTVKKPEIIEKTMYLCEKLKGIGPLTIQCISNQNGEVKFTEINPRFGGGVPLTIKAGVDYSTLLCKLARHEEMQQNIGNYSEMLMLRYSEAVFIYE